MVVGSQGQLLKHGYQLDRNNQPELKPLRPRTIGDAKVLIGRIFSNQGINGSGWDADEQALYLTRKGIEAKEVQDLTPEDVRRVISKFEDAHMVLFRD